MTGRRFRVESPVATASSGAVSAPVLAAAVALVLACSSPPAMAATPVGKAPTAPVEPPLTLENARPAAVPPRPNLKTQRLPAAPPPLFTPDMLDVPDAAKVDTRAPLAAPAATPGLPPVPPREKRPLAIQPTTPAPVPVPAPAQVPTPPPAPAAVAPAAASVALPARPWRVEFATGSSSLPQQAMPLLSTLADAMAAAPNRRLRLLAYAPGDADHQREARQLSLARALAVREKLNALGVRTTRVDLLPLGANVPGGEGAPPTVWIWNGPRSSTAMTKPEAYLTRMLLFLAAVAGVVVVLYPTLEHSFTINIGLNTLILAVLLLGVAYIIRQVFLLRREVAWLNAQQAGREAPEPMLLGPMARMLAGRKGRLSLSALSMRSLLDGIAARLDEQRELSRYLIGLLIFLGLLGTFWGLLHTVRSVGEVISALPAADSPDLPKMFANLQRGLGAPLTGMGTAFSASLFGLAGSLVLGFLELQASQAQNRFFQDVEDWLSGATRLSGGGGSLETGDQTMPAYVQALLEQTAENLDTLRHTVETAEDGRRVVSNNLASLTEKLSSLTDHMRAEQQLLSRMVEGQIEVRQLLARLASAEAQGFDENSRLHLRNIDLHLARISEEASSGRNQAVQDIRSEIKVLTRTLAALAEDAEPR